ncbi:MAG: hypothetical protein ABSG43_25985 [Solirubrobacteraceae bacterium]
MKVTFDAHRPYPWISRKPGAVSDMTTASGIGDQQLDRLAEQLVAGVAQQTLGLIVDSLDHAAAIGDDDRVRSAIEQPPRTRLRLPRLRLRLTQNARGPLQLSNLGVLPAARRALGQAAAHSGAQVLQAALADVVASPRAQRGRERPLTDPPRHDHQRRVDTSASEDPQRLLKPETEHDVLSQHDIPRPLADRRPQTTSIDHPATLDAEPRARKLAQDQPRVAFLILD